MSQDFLKEVLYYQNLNGGIIALVLGASFVLGAIHALGPGHGKSLMAAYLAGAGGRVKDAIIVAVSVTVSHIFSVIIIGFVALWVMDFFKTGPLSLWISLFSGVAILGIGLWLFIQRLGSYKNMHGKDRIRQLPDRIAHLSKKDPLSGRITAEVSDTAHHDHHSHRLKQNGDTGSGNPHGHPHYYPQGISFWSNISLGISGGIVPCPKAIVILLLAISLQKITLGLTIISVFSLGLALVLVAVGIIMVKASHVLTGKIRNHRVMVVPVIGSVIIIGLGLFMTVRTALLM